MAKYEQAAKMIEEKYASGVITADERDKAMDELTALLIAEFGG